jgi:aminocarboxymuconate-semialdehyde decarboxylase
VKKIDTHAHMIFPQSMGNAGVFGPTLRPEGDKLVLRIGPYSTPLPVNYADGMEERCGAAYLVTDMDANGVDMLNLMVAPLLYLYWAPLEVAERFSALQNDLLAKLSADRPDRLFWSATLPMQDVDAAIAEAKRAKANGAKGVNVGTDTFGGGRNLDHQDFWPLYQVLSDLDLPIFVHPYPTVMARGEDDRYHMSWITGFPGQEATAFAALTLGGVLDDFPKLKFIIAHGGGFVPYQFGRISGAYKTKVQGLRAKQPPEAYLKNFWFDTTVHDQRALKFLYEFMTADQLVIGSNYAAWNWQDEFSAIDALGIVPDDDKAKIFHGNAERIYNLA